MLEVVLLAVLKNRADLKYLLNDRWYRIPVEKCPKRKFSRLAFFEPGKNKGSLGVIRYQAKIASVRIADRKDLFPERENPSKKYFKVFFKRILKLKKPVTNNNGMRVSFGYTTTAKLSKAKEITDLFDVAPVEKLFKKALKKRGIKAYAEYLVRVAGKKLYRLDFAVFCKKGALDIECDSEKWHSQKSQVIKDKIRDASLRKQGWSILRLKEKEITGNIKCCVVKANCRVKTLGGLKKLPG